MSRTVHFNPKKEAQVEELFRSYFEPLCKMAYNYVRDFDTSKDIVHDVFTSFWKKYDTLPPDTKYKSYLFTAVRNKSLNYLRDEKKHLDVTEAEHLTLQENTPSVESMELANEIEYGLQLLPDRCRQVFELSRFEGKKYNQIAEELAISVKTVEGQMSKALRLLRDHLKDFLVMIVILLGLG
ncbi:MAG: RNA polymerase sigma-70 factor [Bacteroidota bacterium]